MTLHKQSFGKNIVKTASSILFLTGFGVLVLLPKNFQSEKSGPLKVNANFIEGTQENNVINLNTIVPTVQKTETKHDTVFQYKVKPGDNLSSLAKQHNTTVKNIVEANNLASNSLLRVGQTLYISPTQGVIHQLTKASNPLVFSNTYELALEDLMNVNGWSDPLMPLSEGWEVFVPVSRDSAIKLGLVDKPEPTSFNIYTVQPPKPKAVTKPITKSTTKTVASTNNTKPKTTTQAKPVQTRSYGGSTIIAEWREDHPRGGWYGGHCTAGVSKRASDWLFLPLNEKGTVLFKPFNGNAINWIKNSTAVGLRTTSVPTPRAIVVMNNSSRFTGAGHVAIIESINQEPGNSYIIIKEMNNGALYRVTKRKIMMKDDLSNAKNTGSTNIIGYIPVQDLPDNLHERYLKEKAKYDK